MTDDLNLKLDPQSVDHTMAWLSRHQLTPRHVAAGSIGVFALVVFIGAFSIGEVGGFSDLRQGASDIKALFPKYDHEKSAASFPLMRDLATWGMVLFLGLYMGHIWRQFQLMGSVFPKLFSDKVIVIPESNRADVAAAFELARKRYDALRGSLILPLLAWAAGAGVTAGAARNGVFAKIVRPTDGDPLEAYDGWWARVDGVGGYVAYITIGITTTYFILASVLAAGVLLLLAKRLKNLVVFRYNYAATGKYGGWEIFYQLIGSVAGAFALALASLACMSLQLSNASLGLAIVLVALLMISNPLFFYVPQSIVRHKLKEWRELRREELQPALESDRATQAERDEFMFLGNDSNFPRFRIDWRTVAYSIATSVVVWLLFG